MTKQLLYINYICMQLKLNDLTLIIKFDDDKEKKLIKKFITFKDDKLVNSIKDIVKNAYGSVKINLNLS